MVSVNPYPTNSMPIVEKDGRPTIAFLNLLMQLWTRTGGKVGNTLGVQLTDGEVIPLDTLASDVVDIIIANPAVLKKLTKNIFPTGLPLPWPPGLNGVAVPEPFLLCDGSAVSRTKYDDLFAAIGTAFGPGDGVTTFTLPNFKQAMAWNNALGLLPILSAVPWIIKT